MHPSVIVASISGVCAALGLITTLVRGLLSAVGNVKVNAAKLDAVAESVEHLDAKTYDQEKRLSVLEERTSRE